MTEPGVWVLTTRYNDHDQHGAYFCCVWAKKPTLSQLAEYFKYSTGQPGNVMAAVAFLLHVEAGGGRQEVEDQWYELDFQPFGKRVEE